MRPRLRLLLAVLIACWQPVQLGAQTSVPSAPVNFMGSANGPTITLAWGAPQTGAPIHYYVLDLGIQSGVYVASVPIGPITTFSFDLDPGVYYFRVSAVNAVGQGPPTAEVAVVVGGGGAQVPSPPQQVAATANGSTVTFTWAEPAIGAPITGYVLEVGAAPGVYFGSAPVGVVTSFTVPNVSDGIYYFRVTAVNAVGIGAPSNEVRVVVGVPTTPPSAPQNVYALQTFNTLTFAWSPPAAGAPITGYILEVGPTPGVYPYSIPLGPVTSFDVGSAGTGTTYYFRVTAVNALGQGPPSEEAGVIVGSVLPSAPQNVTVTAAGSAITFSWATPTFGRPITEYGIEFGMAPGVYSGSGRVGLITSLTVPNMPDGIYYFRVTAANNYGAGAPSPEISVVVGVPSALPSAPQNPFALQGFGTLSFGWSPPVTGAPITGYLLEVGTMPGVYPFSLPLGPVTSFNVGSAGTGTTYYFRVTAVNALGQGPPSEEAGVIVGSVLPSAPQNVTATAVGSAITFSWTKPVFGAPIADYGVEFGFASGVYMGVIRVGTITSLTVPGIPDGVYFFRVTAINGYGGGTPSPEVIVVVGVPTQLPSAPQNVYALQTFNTLSFAWSPPAAGTPITGYVLEVGTTPGVYPYSLPLGPVTSFSTGGGGAGVTFYFRVTAVNALGQGPPSEEAGIVLGAIPIPSAPRNLTAAVATPSVTLNWARPTFGAPISAYVLEHGVAPGVYQGSIPVGPVTSITFPNVPDGLLYFRVTAVNAYGAGPPSTEVRVYSGPPCTVPAPPQLSGSASAGQVSLAWTTPSGGPITSYTLHIANSAGGPESVSGDVGLVNSIAGPATSGTYYLRVSANALCGAGGKSNQIAVTVP